MAVPPAPPSGVPARFKARTLKRPIPRYLDIRKTTRGRRRRVSTAGGRQALSRHQLLSPEFTDGSPMATRTTAPESSCTDPATTRLAERDLPLDSRTAPGPAVSLRCPFPLRFPHPPHLLTSPAPCPGAAGAYRPHRDTTSRLFSNTPVLPTTTGSGGAHRSRTLIVALAGPPHDAPPHVLANPGDSQRVPHLCAPTAWPATHPIACGDYAG